MSIWLLQGEDAFRWDGIRRLGRPPSLMPPAWALTERVWEGTGLGRAGVPSAEGGAGGPEVTPEDFVELLLAAIPGGTRRLALVVPDGTRVGAWRGVLPRVLAGLNRWAAGRGGPSIEGSPVNRSSAGHGAGGYRKSLLVASGVHALLPQPDLLRHLLPSSEHPQELLEGWEVIQNGNKEFAEHHSVGETVAGTPVRLHPDYLEADWRILLGEVSYHYFAGFGGGRKLVFPGLAEPSGVAVNHRRAVRIPDSAWADPERAPLDGFEWEPGCAPGRLQGNPVHEDLDQAAALAPPHWVVTALERPPADPDPAHPRRFPIRVVQGPYPAAPEDAEAEFDAAHRVAFTHAPALLLVDGGGGPRDATFLQAHKSLQHAVRFVAPGSRVLLVSKCGDGIGSATLARYAENPGGFRPLAGVAENPLSVLHVQTLVALRRAVSSRRVALWSALPAEQVRSLGMEPLSGEREAWNWCAESPEAWGWLPRAERFLPAPGWQGGGLRE